MATQIPEAYSQLLDKLQANLVSKTETLNYDPMSASTLKSAIAKALRPSYDKAIETRNRTAATNRAMIDADAAARGIGASTWVTDVKNRQNDAAASDIANLESDYSAKLYENLLSRLIDQENKKLTVDQFNAQAKQNALAQALSLTDKYWEKWKTQPASSGGGGSEKKKAGNTQPKSSTITVGELSQVANEAAGKDAAAQRDIYNYATSSGNVSDYNAAQHDYYIGKTIKDTTGSKGNDLAQSIIEAYRKNQAAKKK